MTDKLSRPLDFVWGEDAFALAQRHRASGMELDRSAKARILALYLKRIRSLVGSNSETGWHLQEVMKHAVPALSAKEAVTEILLRAEAVSEGTEDIFHEAVTVLLEELEEQRKVGAKRWIVDETTGRAIVPLTPETIYQPPEWTDEEGRVHKPLPRLHPDIAIGLAEARVKAEKNAKILALAADPVRGRSYRHLSDPQSIAELARHRLREAGVRVMDAGSELGEGEDSVVEFGRENVEADLQSTNESFHRTANYAASLAVKVQKLLKPGATCYLGEVSIVTSPKERWFTVPVRIGHCS